MGALRLRVFCRLLRGTTLLSLIVWNAWGFESRQGHGGKGGGVKKEAVLSCLLHCWTRTSGMAC